MKYAKNTTVDANKSRAEIERTLSRFGATGFMYGWQGDRAVIAFSHQNKTIRFELAMPDKMSTEFTRTPGRKKLREPVEALREWEKATRQRWRALSLVVKAKLEAVECGISSFESEFLAHIVMPNGQTLGQWATPQIEEFHRSGRMPGMLSGLPPKRGVINAD